MYDPAPEPFDPEGVLADLAASGIRWPKPDDHPFANSSDARSIRLDPGVGCSPIETMAVGYFDGARLLLEACEVEGHKATRLGYPAIFLYRQYIELSLKHVIGAYGPKVGVAPNWTSHDLLRLWDLYKKVGAALGAPPDVGDAGAEAVINVFAAADPGSFSYRYPVDRSGRPTALAFTRYSPRVMIDVMEGLSTYLWGAEEYFDHLASHARPYASRP
ncbi:hypothetical protein EJ082_15130 [Brevundimonas diminuta]|uniref:HEPN domain-containing protein n=1 Tax=Brevundimonas diminuta TaxID=293 RepID=A0A410P033_BREDI|nr:hypothetical protein [Brevundimonas diminuta]MBD3574299.1 hypothetical protein [Brevundimonas diminuta]QAT15544.1 hypothetical protein EQG53_15005 [Brevundimonas diminuta]QQB90239.1 hypothetical protein I6H83_07445 [Brevundimonas diminuta]GEC02240.1 hypothetical protein BDI01nite_33040 [Brevundimonas diminuta]